MPAPQHRLSLGGRSLDDEQRTLGECGVGAVGGATLVASERALNAREAAAAAAAARAGGPLLGPGSYSFMAVSDSGNTFKLTLIVGEDEAIVTKFNSDGSFTTFAGKPPDCNGFVHLDGTHRRNQGAYLVGTLPPYREGARFQMNANNFGNGDHVWQLEYASAQSLGLESDESDDDSIYS